MTTTPVVQPRMVLSGIPDSAHPGVYLITLDGNQVVDTDSLEIARACKLALDKKSAADIPLAAGPFGKPRIIEVVPIQSEAPPPAQLPVVVAPPPTPQAAPAQNQQPAFTQGPPTTPGKLSRLEPLPQGLISRADELATQLAMREERCNLLSPAIISQIATGFGASLAIVRIDPSVNFDSEKKSGLGPDCYWSKTIHGGDMEKRSLSKNGLQKIGDAIGIQWNPRESGPLHTGKERNYWKYVAVGYVRTHDGGLQTVIGTKELDLRDGSATVARMTANQVQQQRSMGNELCETKARNRGIRTFVNHVYTVKELQKPFLIVRWSFAPDMSDPAIKAMVTQQALNGIGALYQNQPPPTRILPALPPGPDIDEDDIAGQDPFAADDSPQPGQLASDSDAGAVPPDVKHIAEVRVKKTAPPGSGKSWTLYEIVSTTGETWATFKDEHARVAREAKEKNWPVRIADKENERYPDSMDLESIDLIDPRQPTLPGTEPAKA